MEMLYSMDIASTDSLGTYYPPGRHWAPPRLRVMNGSPGEPTEEISNTRGRTKKVLALEAQISDLETQLEALHLQKDIELASNSMIARVPPEILSQIFVLCVSDRQRMIASLPLVCRLWREVVLATPALHTSICFKETYNGWYPNGAPTYDHIPLLLDRSCDARLSVQISFRVDQTALEQFVTALSPHMGRVYVFNLGVSGPQWARVFREHCAVPLGPALKELTLNLGAAPQDPEWSSPGSRLLAILNPEEIYINLHRLTLDQAALHDVWDVSMPYLRTLEIGQGHGYGVYHSPPGGAPPNLEVSTWLNFLRGLPELEILKLSSMNLVLDSGAVALFAGPERVHMRALKSISFNHVSGDETFMCLSGMDLPVLEVLSSNTTDIGYLAAVCGDISFPCLKTLILPEISLHGCNFLPFVRTLHHLNTITTLGIKFVPGPRYYIPGPNPAQNDPLAGTHRFDILSAPTYLSPRPDGMAGWLVPHLSTLAVGGQVSEETAAQLLKIIRARNAAWSMSTSEGAHDTFEPSVSKITCLRIPRGSILEAATLASLQDSVEEFRH